MRLIVIVIALFVATGALAQQIVPLTGWRAQLDYQLGKIPMSREAHGEVIAILQQWEKAAQAEKPKEPEK